VFFVGFRSDITTDWSFPCPTHSDKKFLNKGGSNTLGKRDSNSELLPWVTLKQAIRDLPSPASRAAKNWHNHVFQQGAKTYPGHTGSALDRPAKALKAGDHGVPGGENMILYPDGSVRYLTVRESARVQTFPDDYVFLGSWTEAMRQLGNAVPKNLAAVVGKSVVKALTGQAVDSRQTYGNEAL
jgi:DNA (cytosine-5)-methyltransferase 1